MIILPISNFPNPLLGLMSSFSVIVQIWLIISYSSWRRKIEVETDDMMRRLVGMQIMTAFEMTIHESYKRGVPTHYLD